MQEEKKLNCLLVTSRITFVPNNYNNLVFGLLQNYHVVGCVELNNFSLGLLLKSIGMMLIGAPRIGFHLFKNCLAAAKNERKKFTKSQNKLYRSYRTINQREALDFIKENEIDIVINARTRCIYKKEVLQVPKIGCVNIHHGLLPAQRGTMCDLWALSENQTSGFTVHLMNENIDDGEILKCVEVPHDKNYPAYLKSVSSCELNAMIELLDEINTFGLQTRKNLPNCVVKNRKNPTKIEIGEIRNKGIRL